MIELECPDGCLACNRGEVEAYLWTQHKITPDLVEQVTITNETTMDPCPLCGAIFLVKRMANPSVIKDRN